MNIKIECECGKTSISQSKNYSLNYINTIVTPTTFECTECGNVTHKDMVATQLILIIDELQSNLPRGGRWVAVDVVEPKEKTGQPLGRASFLMYDDNTAPFKSFTEIHKKQFRERFGVPQPGDLVYSPDKKSPPEN